MLPAPGQLGLGGWVLGGHLQNTTPLPTGNDENDDDEETGGDMKEKEDGDAMLRDFQYSLRCQYMERARNLRVARIDFSWQLAVVVSVICVLQSSVKCYYYVNIDIILYYQYVCFFTPQYGQPRSAVVSSTLTLTAFTATERGFKMW